MSNLAKMEYSNNIEGMMQLMILVDIDYQKAQRRILIVSICF